VKTNLVEQVGEKLEKIALNAYGKARLSGIINPFLYVSKLKFAQAL
jgi:hypothetical protein